MFILTAEKTQRTQLCICILKARTSYFTFIYLRVRTITTSFNSQVCISANAQIKYKKWLNIW